MREELASARQSEYVANRSKKELVASISHDIKTPVSSIKAVSELMLLRAVDEKVIKQLNTIYAKAEQINLLVTDMFHATLEELKELKVTVIEEYSNVLNGMITNVNYDDQISCDPIPECIILTDVTRLQQVFDNILSNSYKYAGTRVTITSHVSRTHLEISINDYGNGITKDELPLLFNKFYRGNNVEGQSGSGLGLYISKYLMQNMQGDIECHNREDGFTVTLKIKLA
jgi:signal transduction histidine kinase